MVAFLKGNPRYFCYWMATWLSELGEQVLLLAPDHTMMEDQRKDRPNDQSGFQAEEHDQCCEQDQHAQIHGIPRQPVYAGGNKPQRRKMRQNISPCAAKLDDACQPQASARNQKAEAQPRIPCPVPAQWNEVNGQEPIQTSGNTEGGREDHRRQHDHAGLVIHAQAASRRQ